jgi:hypothetical protein
VWEHPIFSDTDNIVRIEESRLQYLGYISAEEYRQQRQKREVLDGYLRDLAQAVRIEGKGAVQD